MLATNWRKLLNIKSICMTGNGKIDWYLMPPPFLFQICLGMYEYAGPCHYMFLWTMITIGEF